VHVAWLHKPIELQQHIRAAPAIAAFGMVRAAAQNSSTQQHSRQQHRMQTRVSNDELLCAVLVLEHCQLLPQISSAKSVLLAQ
jgi:hypothetical protein